jgi:fatty-acyl-CoA synthase
VSQLRDAANAARVLQRRGMVDMRKPWEAIAAARDIRRYGAFGGIAAHAAHRYGQAPALTDERGTFSFLDVEEVSNALARGLLAEGIGASSVVGVLNRGHRELLLTVMAANKVGARTVLVNTGFAAPQLADVCRRERIAMVFADDEFAGLLDALPSETVRGPTIDGLTNGSIRCNRRNCWIAFPGRRTARIRSPRRCFTRPGWPPARWGWRWLTGSS